MQLQAQNLARWERSGYPRKWAEDHGGQWTDKDWIELLDKLKHTDFWPMEPDAIGRVLEEQKRSVRTGTGSSSTSAPVEESAADIILQVVLKVVGPDMYRSNAFRVTGLPVTASTREASKELEKARMMEKLGAPVAPRAGPLPLDPPPDGDLLREAMQRLSDPERRAIDEVFWFWPDGAGKDKEDPALAALARGDTSAALLAWKNHRDGAESGTSGNGQPAARGERQKRKHPGAAAAIQEDGHAGIAAHNIAVLTHALALDRERDGAAAGDEQGNTERARGWQEALAGWRAVLQEDAFWARLMARAQELSDPRLSTNWVSGLRSALPTGILSINARLAVQCAENGDMAGAGRHRGLVMGSGFAKDAIDEAMRQAARPVRERIKTLCKNLESEADADLAQIGPARRLIERSQPLLAVMDAVLPPEHATRVGAHDEVALCILRCGIGFGNKTDKYKEAGEVLSAALPVAASESARSRIKENIDIYKRNVEMNLCWFCKTNDLSNACSIPVKMYGNVVDHGTRITWTHTTIDVPRCAACKYVQEQGHRWTVFGSCVGLAMGLFLASLIMNSKDPGAGFNLLFGDGAGMRNC